MAEVIDHGFGNVDALRAEFNSRPFGRHSAELQSLLERMRSVPIPGKAYLYMTEGHQAWSLARMSTDEPMRLEVATSRRYDSLEDAERDVFALRLDALVGRPTTEIDYDFVPATPSVLGYANQDSVHAGQAITFFVSNEQQSPESSYKANIVRLRSPDAGPAAPPFRVEAIEADLNGEHRSARQYLHPGSLVEIDSSIAIPDQFSVSAYVRPTLRRSGTQALLSLAIDGGGWWSLSIRTDGRLEWRWMSADGASSVATSATSVDEHRWSFVWATIDAVAGTLTIGTRSTQRSAWARLEPDYAVVTADANLLAAVGALARVVIGARIAPRPIDGPVSSSEHDRFDSFFNGRIERPRLYGGALSRDDAIILSDAGPAAKCADLLCDWDLSIGISSEQVTDVVGHHDGHTHNLPTRAVRGSSWSGDSLDWQMNPEAYGAIHFHEDDIADADWQPTFEFEVPSTWASGCYALHLVAGPGDEFFVPFFVRPPRGTATSDVAFVVPTATYAAYADMRLRLFGQAVEMQHGRITVADATDLLAVDHPELCASTYDTHRDGSLVCYSSMRRPVTNFRPKGRIYKFCQDLLITSWLDHEGVTFDVVTDEDIHREGVSAISPYRVLVSASHPEYVSESMLDSIEQYLAGGGRLMYIGGNGYYAAAEFHPTIPGTVEVRRPGMETLWPIDHTEGSFSFTGRPAGQLAKMGRRSEPLVGVAFITQGFDACTYYRRTGASNDPRASFIFAGIDDELIGDFGILQGGAAGYEIDRFDVDRGSPPHALVLARSEGHSNVYDLMVASIIDVLPNRDPASPEPIRADLVFFETRGGGAVFSVGSIAWSGSLPKAGYANNVAAVSRNVLNRFRSPVPFEMPTPMEMT